MFGYVRPRRDELRMKDYDAYYAAYCGLCRAMAKEYGFRTRFLVNYDMTFLYLLRAGLDPAAETRKCWCPARVCGRKRCLCDPEGYSRVAGLNMILCYEKIADNIRDSGFFKRMGYRFLRLLMKRPYRKAARQYPTFQALTESRLQDLQRLEEARSPSIDAAADAFASIIAGCAEDYAREEIRRPMQTVLYQVGRFVYLCDALDDLQEDVRGDSYNPFRYRFQLVDGALSAEDLTYLSELMDSSVNFAGSAAALLPLKSYRKLIENILYLGLPAVFSAVKAGTFSAKQKDKPRKEYNR